MKFKTAYLQLFLTHFLIIILGASAFALLSMIFLKHDLWLSILVLFGLYYAYLFFTNHNIDLSKESIIIEKAFFPKLKSSFRYDKVKNIKVFYDKVYGYHKIVIQTWTEKGKVRNSVFRLHSMYEESYDFESIQPTFEDFIDDLNWVATKHKLKVTVIN